LKVRRRLRRYHIWLGWLVGLPLLLWTLSGLVMVARPIGEVRGTGLLREAGPLALAQPAVAPTLGPRPVRSLQLDPRPGGPVWAIHYADGGARLADAATGRLLPPLRPADAAALVRARYTGNSAVAAVDRTSAEQPPLDLRRPVAAWRVTMRDGTRFYLDAGTGELLATRTPFWRFYDLMWGLHIMDLKGREDSHNPLVIAFAAASLITIVLALALLPMTLRRRAAP
jgi:hypothetical protein